MSLLNHVSVGVGDLERALAFYDRALGALGVGRKFEIPGIAAAYGMEFPEFWVQLPGDQQPASSGNGVHVAFSATSREAVDAFHAAALEAGGTDEGAPGPRPMYGPQYYGAFVRDPDGHKVEATLIGG